MVKIQLKNNFGRNNVAPVRRPFPSTAFVSCFRRVLRNHTRNFLILFSIGTTPTFLHAFVVYFVFYSRRKSGCNAVGKRIDSGCVTRPNGAVGSTRAVRVLSGTECLYGKRTSPFGLVRRLPSTIFFFISNPEGDRLVVGFFGSSI